MTFFIPPVFLFGNNANRVPHDEEKKSEYKTAAETEIKVENWKTKRVAELEEENKNLKLENADLMGERDGLKMVVEKLKEENQYRESIADVLPEGEGHIAEETISDLQARIKELKDRIDVLYEFIERNDKLVDEVIDEEDLDKLNRYIYIDDDLVDRTLESED